MKPKGIQLTAQSQLIRHGGLMGTKKINPDEANGFIQFLRTSDCESAGGGGGRRCWWWWWGGEESRDHIARGQVQECLFPAACHFYVTSTTDGRGIPPVFADPPLGWDPIRHLGNCAREINLSRLTLMWEMPLQISPKWI